MEAGNSFLFNLHFTYESWSVGHICVVKGNKNKEKSFQIILPSDVIIALRGTHGFRGIAETANLLWFPSDKMQTGRHPKSYITLLSTASARAEGSKKFLQNSWEPLIYEIAAFFNESP